MLEWVDCPWILPHPNVFLTLIALNYCQIAPDIIKLVAAMFLQGERGEASLVWS